MVSSTRHCEGRARSNPSVCHSPALIALPDYIFAIALTDKILEFGLCGDLGSEELIF